ncbi:Cilia- and flagella-associated protein 77 [Lamellibrachia satsuma]|nr:Cilia- and flagella-associated protein 77 [Lamellibrachia satsuma]
MMTENLRDPFVNTATGVLGDRRETMLLNELILRNELARPVNRGYVCYPGYSFTYGMPNIRRDGGVAEAIGSWRMGKKSLPRKSSIPPRDFLSLNKAAVMGGLITNEEHHQFRATHNWLQPNTDDMNCRPPPIAFPEGMVFGKPTRPSTPINELIEHRYQDRWIKQHTNSANRRIFVRNTQELHKAKLQSKETRASQLRVFQIPVVNPPLWQLPKFSQTVTSRAQYLISK